MTQTLLKAARKAALLIMACFAFYQAQSQCNVTSNWTFNPPIPPSGAYDAGTSVEMCVTISGYASLGANWIHGIQLDLPPAFDMSSLIVNDAPNACANGGQWLYQPSFFCNGQEWGPGFYYDVNSGGPQDGNPCNNFGDPCFGAASNWQFCFTVDLDSDCGGPGNPLDGTSIIPTIGVTGDGDTGSWVISTAGCNGIGNSTSPNVPVMEVNCCDAESGGSPGNVLICQNGTYDLITLLTPPVDPGGFWIGPTGWNPPAGTGLFDPLIDPPGIYTYGVFGTGGCLNTTDINMVYNTNGVVQNIPYCGVNPAGLITVVPPQTVPLITPANITAYFPTGGTWYLPGYPTTQTVLPGGIVTPGVSPAGIYTYTYLNASNCLTTSMVNMIFATGSSSGIYTEYDMCEADPSPFSPFSVLDGSPQPGGQWIRYNENFGFVSFAPTYSQTYNIATGTQPIIDTTYFVYILGTPPCAPGIDTVQVNYHPVINTGDLTVASVCVTDPPFILETLLTGTVTPGQTWTNAFPPNEVIPNLFDPSIYPPNTYLQLQYAGGLAGSLCYNATILQLTILPADANAGDPGTVNVCSTDASFNMEDFLLDDPEDGPPQSGGSWTTPSGTPTGSFFTPGISAPGVYTYSINSTCDSDQATLTVNVTNVPNPGTSGTLNICSNATNVPLISGLTGTPYTPGTWTGAPSGLVDGNNVTNGQVFTYTVGTPPCTATSTVTIALTPAPNAGVLTTTPQLYCATGAPVNLMSLFTTPPSTINAAYWSGPAGFTGGTLNPATATSGLYTYTIPNTGCGPASVSINITIEPQPNAGVDATVNACPNSVTPINLATSLGGGVTTGGAWTYGGAPSTGTFTPGVSLAGVYTYTVTSPLGACSDFANITVNYTVLPNPGTPQSINVCSNAAPFTLNSVNTGAAPGGVWTNPSGAVVLPIPATFNPATSPAGAYTYTIPVAGCASVTNVVTISITPLPNAGTSATSTQCSSFGSIDLTSLLGGTPTTGGTWYNGVTSIGNPYDISTLGGTTLNLQYVLGTAPCQSTSNLTLNVETPTTAGTGNPLAFCSNSAPFNLNTGLTGSTSSIGLWTNGGVPVPNPTSVNPATLGAGATFVYTVTPVSCASSTATVPVTVTPAVTITGVSTTCQPSQTFYTVTFTVNGGQAPFTITGNNGGTLTGNVFTSNPIAVGTPYSFNVQDGSPCADVATSGASPNCTCPATAAFSGGNQNICAGGTASITIVSVGLAPYTVTYTDGVTPVTLTNIGPSYVLNVSPTTTTTYTLQSMNDANCTGTASGSVTVNVEQPLNAGPDVVIPAYCATGGPLNLNSILDAGAYTPGTWTPSGNPTLTAPSSGVYTYTVNGTLCPSDVALYTLTVNPQLSVTAIQATCQPNQTEYVVTFTISGGQAPYSVNGTTIAGTTFTSTVQTSGSPFPYTVSDSGPCADVTGSVPSPVCVCTATAAFTGGNQAICAGGTASIIITNSGVAPYTVTYTDGITPVTLTNIGASYTLNVSPTATTTYTLLSMNDANCIGTASGSVTVNVEQIQTAGPDVALNYCADGSTLNLNSILDPGASTGGNWSPATNVILSAANSGTYTYTVTGTQCPSDNAAYTLTIDAPITVTGVITTCTASQTQYTVEFTINGGQAPYTVNGTTIAGNTFTSALQTVGSPFPYNVDDAGPCAAVSGNVNSPNCSCPATAAFGGGNQTICNGGSIGIPIILVGTGPFDVGYSIGAGPTIFLNGISDGYLLNVSPTATTTYNLVSVTDANCTGSANGAVTVNVEQPLTAGPDLALNYCADGSTLNLNSVLDPGASPGGNWSPATNVILSAANSGTYTYSVTGTQCPSDNAAYTLTIDAPITVTGTVATCNASQTQYTVEFTISGGQPPYIVNGSTIVGNTFTSALQPVGTAFPYNVDDSGPCAAVVGNVNSPNCACPATASFGGGNQAICLGGSADIPIILTGTAPFDVEYNDGTTASTLSNIGIGYLLTVSPTVTTTYNLVSVNDANCVGTANGSVTITIDNAPDAGPDESIDFCADGSTYNLNAGLDIGISTSGTWTNSLGTVINPPTINLTAANSGNYTYTLGGGTCPTDQAVHTMNIAPVITATAVNAVCEANQLEYTVSFTITGGTPPYFVNSIPTGANFTSSLLSFASNPNYSFTISDSGVCSDIVVSNNAPACDCLATGSITGNATICAGSCSNIVFNLSGNGPFTVTYINSNDPLNPVLLGPISNGHQISVCPAASATYTLLNVNDANCTGTVIGNAVDVIVNPPIQATGATILCAADNEGYQIQLNISGGVTPYSFNPAGTYNSATGIYLSPVYPSGTGYNISIDDNGACPAVSVQGPAYTCPCVSSAGTMPTTPQEVCLGSQLTFTSNGNAIVDGNDVQQYILHSGTATTVGTVISTSSNGTFTFSAPGVTAGNTYYVCYAVGNANAFGNVNLNHPCTSYSPGVPVTVNALATASISGTDAVCIGESVDFNIVFTGEGPWDFEYSVDGSLSGPLFSASPTYILSTTQPGTYTVISVSDSNCNGTVSGSATLQNFGTPTANISGSPTICENSGSGPLVSLTGTPPYTFVYAIDGNPQPAIVTGAYQYMIPATVGGNYTLVSVDDNNCSGIASGSVSLSILTAPTATLLGGGQVCEGDMAAFTLQLTGAAPWNVQYTVDGVPQASINTSSSNYTFQSGVGGNYQLVNVQDNNCTGDVLVSQASLEVNALPTAELTSSNSTFCIGQEVELTLNLEGTPPYAVTYIIENDTITATGVYGDIFQTLTPTESFSVEIIEISDGSSPTCTSQPMAFTYISAVELPNAPVLTDIGSCAEDVPLQIGVAGAAGLEYVWTPADHLSNPNIPNPIFSAEVNGILPDKYTYILSASNGDCTARDTMTVTLYPSPRTRFLYSPTPVLSESPVVYFDNKSSGFNPLAFNWTFGSLGTSMEENPTFTFPDGIVADYPVTLTAIDVVTGCVGEASDVISIKPELLVFTPNAFTPDGDGLNDLWSPVFRNVDRNNYRLTVVNRLGEIVFQTNDPDKKWNGSMNGDDYFVQSGVYVWMLETKNLLTLDEVTFTGNVTVVR